MKKNKPTRRDALRKVKCNECKTLMAKGERLKAHWRDLHPEKFRAIQVWLGADDAKLRAAELLAADGMKGAGGISHGPSSKMSGDWEAKPRKRAHARAIVTTFAELGTRGEQWD